MEEEEEVLLSAGKEVSAHWKELPGQRGFSRLSELNPAPAWEQLPGSAGCSRQPCVGRGLC